MSPRDKTTELAESRWNRTARHYDRMMALVEWAIVRKWRKFLWSKVESSRVLEVGVGTGYNIPYYPIDAEITAVDFSEEMLKRARDRAGRHEVKVDLRQMDAQNLEFADNTFDTVVGTMVLCSIPDPVRSIREMERVCKPGSKVVLLEQDFSSNRFTGWLMKLANPLIARIGSDFRRRPMEHVAKSSLKVERVTKLSGGLFKLIEARKL